MTWRSIVGDAVLPSAARGAGTFNSAALDFGPGVNDCLVLVHITAMSGTTPTLTVAIEQSTDGSAWTAINGGGVAALSAVGNATLNAATPQRFVRISAVVAGTTPSVTFRVAVVAFGD